MTIYVKDVLRPLDVAAAEFVGLHRVVHIDGDDAHLMGLQRPWRMPHRHSLRKLIRLQKNKKLDVVDFEGHEYTRKKEYEIPESARKVAEAAWDSIERLVAPDAVWELFDVDMRGRAIGKRADDLGKPVKSLHRILFRYWVYGQTPDAVRPDWAARGGKGKRRVGKTRGDTAAKRIGHPPAPATVSAGGVARDFNCSDDDLAIFKNAMDLYFDECKGSLKGVYDKMVSNLYVDGYREKDGVVVPIPKPASETPSFRMFDHAIHRDWDQHELEKRRIGEREYLQSKRGLNGSGRENTSGPGDRYQIDATLFDIYLVNQIHRSWIIGRPVVYYVMDTFSTMIVGLFVGLWGPSWDCARLALMNAFTDKVEFCRRYGIDITYADWPCTLLPNTLFADRQELLTNAAVGLRKNLNIHCETAQGFRPDLKFIESRFRILNLTSQVQWLPGAVSQREKERSGRDYRLDAVLDLNQFIRILIKAIIHYNKFHLCPQHVMSHPALARATIDPTAISLWNWALDLGMGSLRRERNIDHLRFSLLPTDSVSVTEKGILFRGMHYETDRALKEDWFSIVRGEKVGKLEAAYDSSWTNEIWLRDSTGRFETARLRSFDSLYMNRRIEESEDFQAMKRVIPAPLVDSQRASKAALDAVIDSEVARGKELADLNSGLSKAARIADIRENRTQAGDEEKARIAAEAYGKRADASNRSAKQPIEDDDEALQSSNVIDLMRRQRADGKRA